MALFARVRHGGADCYAMVVGETLRLLSGDMLGEHAETGEAVPLAGAGLLAPVLPSKILAAAVNYPSHVTSAKTVLQTDEAPTIPQLFLKPSSSVIGPGRRIVLPAEARRVDAEGELVAVIGRRCRTVGPAEALDYVFGYTCGNDVSARHWQRDDLQWWRAKGSDTFSPIGPFIATGLDPGNLELRTRLNGAVVQETNTVALIHSTADLISFASQVMTLEPGDLLFTGTPGVTPKLDDGDTVEVEIKGIGVLQNDVRRESGTAEGR